MSKAKPWEAFTTRDGNTHLLMQDVEYGVIGVASFLNPTLAHRVVELLNEHGIGNDPTL